MGAGGDGHQQLRSVQQAHKCGEEADPEGVSSAARYVVVPRYSGEASSHSNHADTMLERLHGNHYLERGQKRRDCRVQQSWPRRRKAPHKHSLWDALRPPFSLHGLML